MIPSMRISVLLIGAFIVWLLILSDGSQEQIVADLAAVRAHCGATAVLQVDNAITRAARRHAQDMATNNYFSHTDQDGQTAGARLNHAGYTGTSYGEVLAAGLEDASEVVPGLMTSPSHAVIMQNCKYTHVGYGYGFNLGAFHKHYWAIVFGAD